MIILWKDFKRCVTQRRENDGKGRSGDYEVIAQMAQVLYHKGAELKEGCWNLRVFPSNISKFKKDLMQNIWSVALQKAFNRTL